MHHTGSFIKLSHTFPTTGAVLGYSKAYRFHCSSSRISVVGGGGHVTDSDNTKVKHFAPINSNNDLCCIRKEKGYVIVFQELLS